MTTWKQLAEQIGTDEIADTNMFDPTSQLVKYDDNTYMLPAIFNGEQKCLAEIKRLPEGGWGITRKLPLIDNETFEKGPGFDLWNVLANAGCHVMDGGDPIDMILTPEQKDAQVIYSANVRFPNGEIHYIQTFRLTAEQLRRDGYVRRTLEG